MSIPTNEIQLIPMDGQPVQRFVNLVLFQAISRQAERIELSLKDASSQSGFVISFTVKGARVDLPPAPGNLFDAFVVVLCNYAGITYSAKVRVGGGFRTKQPESIWLLQSDDLGKLVLLSKR